MEDSIVNNPEKFINEKGLRLLSRQYRVGTYIFDLLFEDRHSGKLIVEIQKGTLDRTHTYKILDYYHEYKEKNPRDFIDIMVIANIIPPERKRRLNDLGIAFREMPISTFLETNLETPKYSTSNDNNLIQQSIEKKSKNAKEAKTVDQHLEGASSELKDLFTRIDIEIMNISSEVERHIVTKEIIYNTSRNFAYLAIQKRNNCLKFYIRTSNDKMNDPKNISKPYRTDQGNITRQVNISPEEEKSGKCSLGDVMNLLYQSYESTQ